MSFNKEVFIQNLKNVYTVLQELKVVEKAIKDLCDEVNIDTELKQYVKSIEEFIQQNNITTEIGGNLEVDGNLQVNGNSNLDVYKHTYDMLFINNSTGTSSYAKYVIYSKLETPTYETKEEFANFLITKLTEASFNQNVFIFEPSKSTNNVIIINNFYGSSSVSIYFDEFTEIENGEIKGERNHIVQGLSTLKDLSGYIEDFNSSSIKI